MHEFHFILSDFVLMQINFIWLDISRIVVHLKSLSAKRNAGATIMSFKNAPALFSEQNRKWIAPRWLASCHWQVRPCKALTNASNARRVFKTTANYSANSFAKYFVLETRFSILQRTKQLVDLHSKSRVISSSCKFIAKLETQQNAVGKTHEWIVCTKVVLVYIIYDIIIAWVCVVSKNRSKRSFFLKLLAGVTDI